jgi:hypothetical protein
VLRGELVERDQVFFGVSEQSADLVGDGLQAADHVSDPLAWPGRGLIGVEHVA